jgi:hypothetical protein
LNLIAKQGGNQKGFCFISSELSEFDTGVYELRYESVKMLADIRKSVKVPRNAIFLDSRIFSWLTCKDGSEVSVVPLDSDVPICKKLNLTVSSTKGLDSKAVSEAISKRIGDLANDFDGLILQKNQRLLLAHLGISFSARSIEPKDDSSNSCRINWEKLDKIHLEPVSRVPLFNLVCVVEIGAAAFVTDVHQVSSDRSAVSVSRYTSALRVLNRILSEYPEYGKNTKFSGFAYSDEVVAYSVFDSETGAPTETTSLYSKSVIESYIEWIDDVAQTHKNKPSNPGQALATAIKRATELSRENDIATIIVLCSSGVHSYGPNPLKEVKKGIQDIPVPIVCVSLGRESNVDILRAIADESTGLLIEIHDLEEIEPINDILVEWFHSRS